MVRTSILPFFLVIGASIFLGGCLSRPAADGNAPELLQDLLDGIIDENHSYQRFHVPETQRGQPSQKVLNYAAEQHLPFIKKWDGPICYRSLIAIYAHDGAAWIAIDQSKNWIEVYNGP